jgi:hypothetical protein
MTRIELRSRILDEVAETTRHTLSRERGEVKASLTSP